MTKKRRKLHEPIETSADKSQYLRDSLMPVLEKHFAECPDFNPKQAAGSILADYDDIMYDFWSKEEATTALDELKRALFNLSEAYDHIPHIVSDRLGYDVVQCDDLTKQSFLDSTRADVIWPHMLPERGASEAYKALAPLAKHHKELIAAIEITRRELPEGIPTRNRQSFEEWALIHVCVQLVKKHNAMNIPKAMDNSGPLCHLLKEVFGIFGIKKNSFKRVFESWRENMDGKYESFDLMSL